MAWGFIAKKGQIVRTSGAHTKKPIEEEAKRLRKIGYKVRVYEVK